MLLLLSSPLSRSVEISFRSQKACGMVRKKPARKGRPGGLLLLLWAGQMTPTMVAAQTLIAPEATMREKDEVTRNTLSRTLTTL